jgi:hypothetical protein
MKLRISAILVLSLAISFSYLHKAAADTAAQQTPSGITLSPAVVQASIGSTESEHELKFQITNNKPNAQTINISAADFNTLNESGGLVFVGTNPTELQKKYGLTTWITLPQTSVTLEPKQSSTITAIISNQASLAPGGHYGAIMLALDNKDQSNAQNKVAVHPIATSLLFVNKVGGDTHKLRLTNANISHNIFKLPSQITLRFYNDGNTHLVPRGTVDVTDPHGKLVAKGIINENSNLLLPETYRLYSVPLKKVGSSYVPGKYKITTNFRFDGYDQFRSYQASQFILAPMLLLLVMLVVVVIASIVVFLMVKNRKLSIGLSTIKKRSKNNK